MKDYDNYNGTENYYMKNGRKTGKLPDSYEDISSDYTPEEKERLAQRNRKSFTADRQVPLQEQRKFYDNAYRGHTTPSDDAVRRQAELRQQELAERRRAREAQDAARRQQAAGNDYYRANASGTYSGTGTENYTENAYDHYMHYGKNSRDDRNLEDTLEGVLLGGYTSNGRDVPKAGVDLGGRGRPPRNGHGGRGGSGGSGDSPSGGRPPKRKKKHVLRTVLIVILVIVLAGGTGGWFLLRDVLSGLKQTDISDLDKLGISDAIDKKYGNQNIINFALFGIDTHDDDSMEGRSDSIIIVSVNRGTGAVKLISILRDAYVPIEGHKKDKITHAYAFGGPELAINTINQNFQMNIQDYATVNFAKMADIIDLVGGIDLEITRFEWEYTNGIGQSTYNTKTRKEYEDLEGPGQVHMNGKQAVSYARIRSDSDVARAERQRTVLSLVVEKIKGMSVFKYPNLLKQMLGFVETSMSYDEIMGFIPMVSKTITISQETVPDEEKDNAKGGNYGNYLPDYNVYEWVWKFDIDAAAERIHQFIYEQ